MKWLGVETEFFHSAPHVMRQPITSHSAGGASTTILPGQDIRLNTWAPINIVVRHQMGQFEPYAGIGMGVFFAHLRDGATHETSDSTTVGLNTQIGLRYLVTKNISLFGDFKFIRTSFNFAESSPTQAAGGFKGDYMAHIVSIGVGYHF
jgi:opacity protein-like surface antigen